MAVQYIPTTQVAATLIPSNTPHGFVPMYLTPSESGPRMAAVNAGTSNPGEELSVGLGGINGAFATALNKAGQDSAAYETIHQQLLDNAADNQRTAIRSEFTEMEPLQFAMLQKPDSAAGLPGIDGLVFLDIFRDSLCPGDNPSNYAMLYLVPPNRNHYPTEKAFLDAVETTSANTARCVETYNTQHAAAPLAPIECIRMCLFSGGIYRGNAQQDAVARRNLAGLAAGFSAGATVQRVEFANSYDKKTQQHVFRIVS